MSCLREAVGHLVAGSEVKLRLVQVQEFFLCRVNGSLK